MSTGGLCALVPYFLFRVYVTSSRSSFGPNLESEMSDSDPLPRFPFALLPVSHGESAGFSSPQDLGSRPRDQASQVSFRSQGGHVRTCAQHICGPPQLSLHGLGHPTPSSEVSHTSHRDGVQTIHGDQSTILPPAAYGIGKNACDGPLDAALARRPCAARWGDLRHRRWATTPSPST